MHDIVRCLFNRWNLLVVEVELAGEGPRGLNRTQEDLVWRHTVNTNILEEISSYIPGVEAHSQY